MKKRNSRIIMSFLIMIVVLFSLFYDWNTVNSYQQYNTSPLRYVKAVVLSVESENISKESYDSDRYMGTQEITVKVSEGEFKNQEVKITNYLSTTSNVRVEMGQKIIICVDHPENANPYFTVYNYDRSIPLVFIFALFALALILVGGVKGVRSLVGLIVTMVIILGFLVQAIYHGCSVVPFAIFTLWTLIWIVLYIISGLENERKTMLFGASTLAGVFVAAVFCVLCQSLLHISGYNFSDVEALYLIMQNTGLEIKHLLFAGVLISSLGAVMDVGVSIVSALYEVKKANPLQGRKELFHAGMNIGKDMIGTMSNTLILAFTGTTLTTILLLIAFGYQPVQLLNSDYLTLEVVRGISSTFAVVMTVPAASAISAMFIRKEDV